MIMTKENCKKAMALNPELAEKLCYKAQMVRNLTDQINGIDNFSKHSVGSRQKAFNLRKNIMLEMLNTLGALAGEYKREYGQNLFDEYVDYRNYTRLEGEARIKTVGQMSEILRTADECCREVWADYLEDEGDTYLRNAQ